MSKKRAIATALILAASATSAIASPTSDDPLDLNDLPVHATTTMELRQWPHATTTAELSEATRYVASEFYPTGRATVTCGALRPALYLCRTTTARYSAKVLLRVWEDGSALAVIPGPKWTRVKVPTKRTATVVVRNGRTVSSSIVWS